MRILLDESLPRRLRTIFIPHEVVTVVEAGWSGVTNGDLLRLAAPSFDVFVTADQNLQYQQNIEKYSISFIILNVTDNNYETILPLIPQIKLILQNKDKPKLITIA